MTLHLDHLVVSGRITGWGYEPTIGYLSARRPTMSYRMYSAAGEQDANLGAFMRLVAAEGVNIRVGRAYGSVRPVVGWDRTGIGEYDAQLGLWRTAQVVLTVTFASDEQLRMAVALVSEQFTREPASGHQAGSWEVPDARVSGVRLCPDGMMMAYAFSRPEGTGHVVVLGPSDRPPFDGARCDRLFLPSAWQEFLS